MAENGKLKSLVSQWLNVIHLARKAKENFDEDADELMGFYDGNHSFMWDRKNTTKDAWWRDDVVSPPSFRVTINKAYEAVSIFGPHLYNQNPFRSVNPRRPLELDPNVFGDLSVDPMTGMPVNPQAMMMAQQAQMMAQQRGTVDKTRASLMQGLLNYTPVELDLKRHMRIGIDESIIKGMGTWWTEVTTKPGSNRKLVGTFWSNSESLLFDGDVTEWEDAQWIARKCIEPVWQVEDDRGYPRGTLKANMESLRAQGANKVREYERYDRQTGKTNDLMVYWRLYSKMGMGDLLSSAPPEVRGSLDQLGKYVYLELADGVDYPLNLPPWIQESGNTEVIFEALQWPTPFWADGQWPCTVLAFKRVPGKLYPISILKPAVGELRAINWIAACILGKIRTTSRDFIATVSKVSKDFKDAIRRGGDLTHLELENASGQDVRQIVQFLQHPEMNADIWRSLELFIGFFDRRTGLNELLYGESSRQLRTAEEAKVKSQGANIRPNDMSDQVDDISREIARKEALASRWHLAGEDVRPLLGDVEAMLWDQFVASAPLDEIMREMEYTIESGSARRRNSENDADVLAQVVQAMGPVFGQYAFTTGDTNPLNQLMARWVDSMGGDPDTLMLPPVQMAPPPQEQGNAQEEEASVPA